MTRPNLVVHGITAVTVDRNRRVLEDAWLAITGDRISAIGTGAPPQGERMLTGRDWIAIPGLIDAHSHAGHGLIRAAGDGDGEAWMNICEEIYSRGSTLEFWRAEARLTQLERLQSGVTTALTLLGGGPDVMRTDAPEFGDAHAAATLESGLRTIMAVGPSRLPFPKSYARISADSVIEPFELSFEQQMTTCETLIGRWCDVLDARCGTALILPVYTSAHLETNGDEVRRMADRIMQLRAETGVSFTQDGHRGGSIALAEELGLLGPWAVLSHSIDLTEADFAALQRSGASVSHNPSAIMSIIGRCPAPELIDAGINVCLSSDASAPDRGYDMFRHMAQAMHYHRRHFRDPSVLPEGKALEMCTIDAAKALGLDADLGSIEVGKKADIVLVDGRKPHLYPPTMPLTRLTHFCSAADVDTVIVDGRVLLDGREAAHMDVDDILGAAAREADRAFECTASFRDARQCGPETWGAARRHAAPFRAAGD